MDVSLEEEEEDLDIFDAVNSEPQNLPVDIHQEDLEGEGKDDDEKEKKVKPKRIIRNPRVTLNAERLKGPKGLGVLEGCFEKVKFKGKGHEEKDLNVLLKTYEYWCHRLFPRFSFEDTIVKIEKLGAKGPIQTHLKKVRSGMIEDDDLSIAGVAADLRSDEEVETDEAAVSRSAAPSATQTIIEDIPIELTEEQLETIRRNRVKAEKLRQERLKKIQEKASLSLPESNIAAPIEQPSTEAMDEEFPVNSITKLQETTRKDSDDNNEEISRTITTSHVEDCLQDGNDLDEVNSEENRKSELHQQSIEECDVENEDSTIVGKELNNQAVHCNSLIKQISDDETGGGTENESQKMNVDPEQ